MVDFLGAGWRFPIEKAADPQHIAMVQHEACIKRAIHIILSTAKGERVMRPDFGCDIHELVFAPNSASTRGMAEYEVRESLRIWEPRIDVIGVKATVGGENGEVMLINIEYHVRQMDNRFNLVYPFYLERGVP